MKAWKQGVVRQSLVAEVGRWGGLDAVRGTWVCGVGRCSWAAEAAGQRSVCCAATAVGLGGGIGGICGALSRGAVSFVVGGGEEGLN